MAYISLDDPEKFKKKVHLSFRAWLKQDSSPDELLADLFLVELERRKLVLQSNLPMLRMATNTVLERAIEQLAVQDIEGADVLRWRFTNNETRQEVANRIHVSEFTVSRIQSRALDGVTAVLMAQEASERKTHAQKMASRLPAPTYSKLFGRDDVEAQLYDALMSIESPWLIAVVGMGGIGKTALADKVVRRIIPTMRYENVVWLHAEQGALYGRNESPTLTFEQILIDLLKQIYPDAVVPPSVNDQLYKARNALNLSPHLVIVDNLETEEDIAYMMNQLNDLAKPSKFLLTTRTLASRRAHVVNIELNQLSYEAARDFIYFHAEETGITAVSEISDENMRDIYQLTGGNPLALIIIVSQLDTIPLPRLLAGLNQSYPTEVDDMYKRIFWYTWQTLSEHGRQLLQAMHLVPEAADADYLLALSGLEEGELWRAIEELRQRSLLNVNGGLQDKSYSIHPLTRTFLKTDILNQSSDADT